MSAEMHSVLCMVFNHVKDELITGGTGGMKVTEAVLTVAQFIYKSFNICRILSYKLILLTTGRCPSCYSPGCLCKGNVNGLTPK